MISLPRINPQRVAPGIILKRDIPAKEAGVVATGPNPEGFGTAITPESQPP